MVLGKLYNNDVAFLPPSVVHLTGGAYGVLFQSGKT